VTPHEQGNLDALFEQDASSRSVTDTDVTAISALAAQQISLERRVEAADKALVDAKEALRKVAEIALPDLMLQAGVEELKLSNGRTVSVKPFYNVHISEERQAAAMAKLREYGEDEIIKNVVMVPFAKGRDEDALALRSLLETHGFTFEQKQSVHGSTLKRVIKDRITKQLPVDAAVFGLHSGNMAVIK
jgi:hypothetical protein